MIPPSSVPVTRSMSSSSTSSSKYNSSAHRPQSRNNSTRVAITNNNNNNNLITQASNKNYDYDNLNYENFLAATNTAESKQQHLNLNNTVSYLPQETTSRAINELSNLIADSNILMPVNTLPKSNTITSGMTGETTRGSYTRSRSSGPISANTKAPILEKKSLDKFLKLASNSASLLDINSSNYLQQQQQQQSSSNSNTKLKTSSTNLIALCGVETPNPIIDNVVMIENNGSNNNNNNNSTSTSSINGTEEKNFKNSMNRRPQTLKFDSQSQIINAKTTPVIKN